MTKSTTTKRTFIATLMIGALGVTGLLSVQPAMAASSLYVATGGIDSATCGAPADPCQTIQQAVDNAVSGDTVTVAAGTYTEAITIDKSLTLKGQESGVDARTRSAAETVINVPAGSRRGIVIEANNVTIDGVTVDGTSGDDPTVGVFAYGAAVDASNLHVINSIFTHNSVGVDVLSTNRSGLVVSQNLFDTNGKSGAGAGVYVNSGTGDNVTVTDNDFKNTDDGTGGSTNAILIKGGAADTLDGVTVTGNTSTNDGSFLYLEDATSITVENNTADTEAGHGVLINDNVSRLTIDGNTFTGSVSGVDFAATNTPTTDATITNNTISGMSGAGVLIGNGSITGSPTIKDNSITGNTTGIDNKSTVKVSADNNWWGCTEGPDAAGCDSTSGSVTASIWYTDAAMTTVNYTPPADTGDTLADTGENTIAFFAAATLMIASALGGLVIVRRRMSRQ